MCRAWYSLLHARLRAHIHQTLNKCLVCSVSAQVKQETTPGMQIHDYS